MAIRKLAAVAALVAFTTPAFAQSAEEMVMLDESVSSSGLLALAAASGVTTIAGLIAFLAVAKNIGDNTPATE